MNFHSNKLSRLASFVLAATLSVTLANCGGGANSIPGTGNAKPTLCLQSFGGCGGGGTTGVSYSFTEGNFISYATTGANYTATGHATTITGSPASTFSGSANISTGVTSITASVPAYSSQPFQISYLDVNHIVAGTNSLPGGGTLTVDSVGNATATITDAHGIVWTITGALQPDGHDVAVTFASSQGQFTATLDGAAFAPTALAGSTTAALSRAQARSNSVHVEGSTAGGIAVIAGVVAAAAGLVAVSALLIPGGQPVSVVAGLVSGVAGCVAAGAAAYDYYYPAPAPTAAPTGQPKMN